mmetsp:Transcript_3854/g.8304  ORF Transcript_3854/g.8304 Transcript_3854/m.8304 type:complete len:232 (+) Transcript_3854:53-748(+)
MSRYLQSRTCRTRTKAFCREKEHCHISLPMPMQTTNAAIAQNVWQPYEALRNVYLPSASGACNHQEATGYARTTQPNEMMSVNHHHQLNAPVKPPATTSPGRTSTLFNERTLNEYQAANDLIDFSNSGQDDPPAETKRVRFAPDTYPANESLSEDEVFLQARILLKILEEESPEQRDYVAGVLRHCMKICKGSERSEIIRMAMKATAPPNCWRLATDARRRLVTQSPTCNV